jgi:hypothetical protein
MAVVTGLVTELANVDLNSVYTLTAETDAFLLNTFRKREYGGMHDDIVLSFAPL